ncbi:MAG: hypothetical protein ACI4PH_02705 [Faecousia sp.]
MKSYRSTFEENYKAVPEPCDNKRGCKIHYVYIGPWYVWNTPRERIQTAKRLISLACVFSVLIFFLGSVADSPLNYARYVEFPGSLSLAALIFEVIGVVQFCAAREKMTNMDFDDIRRKLLIAPPLHGLLLFWAVIAALIQLAGRDVTLMDAIVPLCFFLSGALSVLIFLYYRSLPYRKEENENAMIGLEDEAERPRDADCPG